MFQKLLPLLLFLLPLLLACHAGGSAPPLSLEEKFSQLRALSSRKPHVVRLDLNAFQRFVETPPRNYSAVVMFTATRLRPDRCPGCRGAVLEFQALAKAWRQSPNPDDDKEVFFGTVELSEAPEVFTSLGVESVPTLLHFPPASDDDNVVVKQKPSEFDPASRGGHYGAELMAAWVSEETGVGGVVHVATPPPPDVTKAFLLGLFLAAAAALAYLRLLPEGGKLLSVSALFLVLLATSGQVWNHVRAPPFVYHHPEDRRRLTFVHPSSQAQFGAEAYMVAAFNAGATAGLLLLCQAAAAPGGGSGGGGGGWWGAKGKCLLGNVLVMGSFVGLEHVFRAKH